MVFVPVRVVVAVHGGGFFAATLGRLRDLFGGRGLTHAARRGREGREQALEVGGLTRGTFARRRILRAHERFELMAAGAAPEIEERHAINVSCF